ncbi:MAG: hypothetical protein ACREGR_01080, partial [Minisyncoccia bacterium]
MKYRYQYDGHTSNGVLPAARRVFHKLGQIKRIEAKRYNPYLKSSDGRYRVTGREAIRIIGNNGTALFSGVSWGYAGSGPRAAEALLLMAGVPRSVTDHLVYKRPRTDETGIDWYVTFGPKGCECDWKAVQG